MIKINKSREPLSWTEHKNTPGAIYQATEDLRRALLEEQGHICAYCLRRIPTNDIGNRDTSRIEHVKPRSIYPRLELDYENMVICCPGYIDGTVHCDKSKGNQEISFSPFTEMLQNSLSYSSKDGAVKSSNQNWDVEINNVIQLNNRRLKYNRQQALDGVRQILEKRKWRKSELSIKKNEWTSPDNQALIKEYCGIVIWYLEKKLRQL